MQRVPRNVWVASLTSFLTDVSSEMVLNVLPLFLANVLGAPMAAIGLIEGAAAATSSLLKVYAGALSDRWGARKPLAVAGYAISALAKPGFALATTWGGVAAVRWAERVGKGIRTAPRDALLWSYSNPGRDFLRVTQNCWRQSYHDPTDHHRGLWPTALDSRAG